MPLSFAAAAILLLGALAVPPSTTTPRFKWAERVDRVFITVVIPQLAGLDVGFEAEAQRLRVRARSERDGAAYALDVELFGAFDAVASGYVAHRDRVDITLEKRAPKARWFQLLKGAKSHPQMSVDWSKYRDYDEELDELEVRSGARGIAVPAQDRELKSAVDDYWQRRRIEEREKSAMPSLDDVTKAAEAEWNAGDKTSSFQDVVSRKWREEVELRKRERALDEEEDAWAGWSSPGGGGGAQRARAAGAASENKDEA